MKKILLAIACLATVSFTSNAQMKITVAGGFNNAAIAGYDGASSTGGIHVGGLVGFGLSEKLSLQPGLFYSTKGAKYEMLGTSSTLNLSYIEIPVNVVYTFGESGFAAHAGPYLGMMMSAKVSSVDVKEMYKSMDFGLNLGASYTLPMGLMFRLQYGIGMADINNKDKSGVDKKLSNVCMGITVGYTLGGGRD